MLIALTSLSQQTYCPFLHMQPGNGAEPVHEFLCFMLRVLVVLYLYPLECMLPFEPVFPLEPLLEDLAMITSEASLAALPFAPPAAGEADICLGPTKQRAMIATVAMIIVFIISPPKAYVAGGIA